MDLREDKGVLFDYSDRYSVTILCGSYNNAGLKSIVDTQAAVYKNMNDMQQKIAEACPCSDQYGNGYFFYIPDFDGDKDKLKNTFFEAFSICQEMGHHNFVIQVCGDSIKTVVKSIINDYDQTHSNGLEDVLLL